MRGAVAVSDLSVRRRRAVRVAVCLSMLASLIVIAPEASAQGRPRFEGDEREAARIYADAKDDLAAGDKYGTQRLLERLVARYPETQAAANARRDLHQLYSEQFRQAERRDMPRDLPREVPPPPQYTPPPASAPPPPQARSEPPPSAPVASFADVSADRLQALSDDFKSNVGDRIFFADGTADIGTRARAALEAQAAWLARNPQVMVTVEGHADERSGRDQNMKVSEVRADVVRQRLIDLGVESRRIAIVGYGRDRPVANCAEAHCAAQNRRAVLVIGAGEGKRTELKTRGEIKGRLVTPGSEPVQ
jgi:peptidoglycan-associated lipoprotein